MISKLKVDDVIQVIQEYYGLKKGVYRIIGFDKNRLGADMYKLVLNRRNAATEHYLYVDDVDRDLIDIRDDYKSKWSLPFAAIGASIIVSSKFKCNK